MFDQITFLVNKKLQFFFALVYKRSALRTLIALEVKTTLNMVYVAGAAIPGLLCLTNRLI